MRQFHWILLLVCAVGCVWSNPLRAHAVLERAEPAANASLTAAPEEVRLWFTEPLEPDYSRITLRDDTGAPMTHLVSLVDAVDPYQMAMPLDALPDGLYTVVWQVVSAADGHPTEGSFPFTVGNAAPALPPATAAEETLPLAQTLVRWLNLCSLALLVGSLGFICFVWQAVTTQQWKAIETRMQGIVWAGWVLAGLGGYLMLAQQTATMADLPLIEALSHPALSDVIKNTRFGMLWSARMAAWLLIAGMLFLAHSNPGLRWVALAWGLIILLLQSLFSHAAGVEDALPAIVNDWLHFAMTAFWIGGLVQFFGIIRLVQRTIQPATPFISRLAGYFSNYARLAVGGLIVSGLYAAWLFVGTFEGLLTTVYGRALLVKLFLIAPLLAIAGFNLVVTQRRLQSGSDLWAGRLRDLIAAEIALALAVLVAVGLMTSISPARSELNERAALEAAAQVAAAAPKAPTEPQPVYEMQEIDDLLIRLDISPGWVGENTFTVTLTAGAEERPVTDASLIRMRFDHQTEDLGQSELRITEGQDGVYSVRGANLSAPGDWRIRMTVQRPNEFDAVVDFNPQVESQPRPVNPQPAEDPPGAPVVVDAPPVYRTPVLLTTGLLILGLGAYTLGRQRFRIWQGMGALAGGMMVVGGLFLAAAILT